MPVFIKKPQSKVAVPLTPKIAVPPKTIQRISVPDTEYNPMLAAEGVLGQIPYPILVLPKHNGVRGENQKGALVARSLKPIPNHHTRSLFSLPELTNLGGELVVGDPFDEEVFTVSTSGVMTQAGEPDVVWYVFDWYHPTMPFEERIVEAHRRVDALGHDRVQAIPYHWVQSDEELVALSETYLLMGFEGVVLRRPKAKYKQGRSTKGEAGFMRYCPWHRDEGIITAIHEGQVNQNVSKKNELGYLKKSSHKENMVGSGRAGSVTVLWKDGIDFDMAVPTVALQDEVWKNPANFMMKAIKFKFKPPVKVGGKPRFPQWEGIRSPLDMS